MISETKLKKILNRINTLEALADSIKHETTMFRKELSDSGVSDNSPKGLSDRQIAEILAKRQKSRLRKRN